MNILTELGFDNRAAKLWLQFEAARRGCQLHCGPYAWDLTKDSRTIRIGRRQFGGIAYLATQFDALFESLEPAKAGYRSLLDFSRVRLHKYRVSGVAFELAQWPEPDAVLDAYFKWYEPHSGDLVFDLGAEFGVGSYILSQFAGSVISLEPDPRKRVILERNVDRHGLANVTVTKESIASLSELIRVYGQPVFCKVNLDEIPLEFLRDEAEFWFSFPILFAAHGKSASTLRRFKKFLKKGGFETASNPLLGLVWGRRAEGCLPE